MKLLSIKKDVWLGLLLMCGACGTASQSQVGNPDRVDQVEAEQVETTPVVANRTQAQTGQPVRGTATVEELAQSLFAAIQTGNPSDIEQYFLTDREIEELHRIGSPDLEAVLEQFDAAQIESQFHQDYNRLVETATARQINWSEVNLGDVRPQRQTNQDQHVFPVEVTLSDRTNRDVQMVFEVVRLDNRYFLFRRLAFK